jgi:hypothetical protein
MLIQDQLVGLWECRNKRLRPYMIDGCCYWKMVRCEMILRTYGVSLHSDFEDLCSYGEIFYHKSNPITLSP